jgi:hypothetical protein
MDNILHLTSTSNIIWELQLTRYKVVVYQGHMIAQQLITLRNMVHSNFSFKKGLGC